MYFFTVNAVVGLMLLFFTYELVPILSARFFFLFWLIEMIIWLASIWKVYKKVPEIKKAKEEEKEFKKYIP